MDLNEGLLFLLKLAYFLYASYTNTHVNDIYVIYVDIYTYIIIILQVS